MKKAIIALAAASSVALSHGVAVAEEGSANTKPAASSQQGVFGSGDNKKENQAPEKGNEGNEDKKDPRGKETGEGKRVTGSTASDFCEWDENTSGLKKLQSIAASVAAVVALLGSVSSLFANIEKIVKQFTK